MENITSMKTAWPNDIVWGLHIDNSTHTASFLHTVFVHLIFANEQICAYVCFHYICCLLPLPRSLKQSWLTCISDNSLQSRDALLRLDKCDSTFTLVMICCLMATSLYFNQCQNIHLSSVSFYTSKLVLLMQTIENNRLRTFYICHRSIKFNHIVPQQSAS